jgi:hypothetical protein
MKGYVKDEKINRPSAAGRIIFPRATPNVAF